MKKTFILLWLVLILASIYAIKPDFDYSDNTVIVVLKPEISNPRISVDDSFFGDLENAIIENISLIYNEKAIEALAKRGSQYQAIYKLTLPSHDKALIHQTIDILNKNPQIDYATPDYLFPADDVTPNDEYYEFLWGLNGTHGIKAPQAWEITTGSQNIRVGVIDSGIATHPDLDANVTTGYDFYHNDTVTTDDPSGHGTHVAGTIGAVGNNEIGVVGVNWNVTLVPLQPGGDTYTYASYVVSAITYATNTWGTDEQISILNQSLAGYGKLENSDPRPVAINNYPGLFVWSAGNGDPALGYGENVDNLNVLYYNLSNLIAVGAIQPDGQKAEWSNYSSSGEHVHVYAPGVSIGSTVTDAGYDTMDGTSMAAPHVSGVAALLLSVNPSLSAAQLKHIIMDSADPIVVTTGHGEQTVKRLNAESAVHLALNWLHLPISPTAHDFGMVEVNDISEGQTFTISAGDNGSYTIDSITITGEQVSEYILEVVGLPWILSAGETRTFSVSFSPTSLGVKTAAINISTNINEYTHIIHLSGKGWHFNADIPYSQNFDQATNLNDICWTGNLLYTDGIGRYVLFGGNNTNALWMRLNINYPAVEVYTPTLNGVTARTTLTFDYQIFGLNGYDTPPYQWAEPILYNLSPEDKVYIEASTTGGTGTYTTLYEINDTNHTIFQGYRTIELPLSAFAGENVNIRFRAETTSQRWFFILENVVVADLVSDSDEVTVPLSTALVGNYPNPFNPETVISFSLGAEGLVNLDIYNVRGQKVRSLAGGAYGVGVHSVVWNGCSDDGRSVGSGVYFYRMVSGEYVGVKKMLLVK